MRRTQRHLLRPAKALNMFYVFHFYDCETHTRRFLLRKRFYQFTYSQLVQEIKNDV